MKKSTKFLLLTAGASIATIYAYNKFIENTATKKNLLIDTHGEYFSWKDHKIFFSKSGTGSPILLIHDADATASSVEWERVARRLEKNHTVYAIDLLGCGRSDKPALEYTNYLYVQLITAFVKEVIKEKPSVVATNLSASFVIMANHMDESLFSKMIFVNPASLKQLDIIPDDKSKLKKRLIELPFVGTFIYNLMVQPARIDDSFRNNYYEKPQLISSKLEETYYEAAHRNGNNGRYLYSSKLGRYLNNTTTHAVKIITKPTLIIGCTEIENNTLVLDDYHRVNPNLEIVKMAHGNLYPHLEIPDKISKIIEEHI